MTVYSFVRRANVPNICGIPSVGLGLKSDLGSFQRTLYIRAHARVDVRSCERADPCKRNEKNTRLLKLFTAIAGNTKFLLLLFTIIWLYFSIVYWVQSV